MVVDDGTTVYVTGRFYYTVDFDPTLGVDSHTSGGDADIYLTKYDTGGNWYWARTYSGTSYDAGTGVAVDKDENAYVTGYFRSNLDFNPGPDVDEHVPNMQEDTFLMKLLPNGYWE